MLHLYPHTVTKMPSANLYIMSVIGAMEQRNIVVPNVVRYGALQKA